MVFEGSAAEAAGVQVNDLIVEVNQQATPTREKLVRTIQKQAVGDLIVFSVERGGQRLSMSAVLTPKVKGMPNDRSQFQNQLG